MKHFMLKFNHGVEIGAEMAYRGHFFRTGDHKVQKIMFDEIGHREDLKEALRLLNEKPSKLIDSIFFFIGSIIGMACLVAPIWSLNWVASRMEMFAIFNYRKLASRYPQYAKAFEAFAETENEHRKYFQKVS